MDIVERPVYFPHQCRNYAVYGAIREADWTGLACLIQGFIRTIDANLPRVCLCNDNDESITPPRSNPPV